MTDKQADRRGTGTAHLRRAGFSYFSSCGSRWRRAAASGRRRPAAAAFLHGLADALPDEPEALADLPGAGNGLETGLEESDPEVYYKDYEELTNDTVGQRVPKKEKRGKPYAYTGAAEHVADIAASLPASYQMLLNDGWTDISYENEILHGSHYLKENQTGLVIRFDERVEGAPGFAGKGHYHICNPDTSGGSDYYLDVNGNPVSKKSKRAHIIPKEE